MKKRHIIKSLKWLTLIFSIGLFGYRIYLVDTSTELKDKALGGKYDSSKEGIIVSIITTIMFVIFAIFYAIDSESKKSE
jgi:hypothetical protein